MLVTDRTLDAAPATERIAGLDVARAFAILGMVLVNFKVVMGAETSQPAWLVTVLGQVDGRAAALFVTLAGVGISLLWRKVERAPDGAAAALRGTLLRRALFLFVLGLSFVPVWPADILHFYGLYIALAVLFLRRGGATLLLSAVTLTVVSVPMLLLLDYEAEWDWTTLTYHGIWTARGMVKHLLYNGFHPVVPWLGFLLVGMWVGRRDLRSPAVRRRLLIGSAAIFALAEAASRVTVYVIMASYPALPSQDAHAIFGPTPMPPTPFYMVSSAALAVTAMVVSIALARRFSASPAVRVLVATGQLSLTLYLAHVVVGMGLLDALGRLRDQSILFVLGTALLFWAAAVVFAALWRRSFARGPIEWAMRRIAG